MSLDPQAEQWLAGMAESGLPPLNEMSVADARATYAAAVAEYGLPAEPVNNITDRGIPGPGGAIPIRIYTPLDTLRRAMPALVYFHGGGYVLGDLDVVHSACTILANRAHAVVVSVDYRLAPEHPFPAAVEDAWAATRWVADNATLLDVDPERIAVGGDSAGATLAAVTALANRDSDYPALAYQLLFYPVTDVAARSASFERNGDGYFLTAEMMAWFIGHYLPEYGDRRDERVSPLRATNLSDLPPALVVTAEYDPLCDEAEAFAQALNAAGTEATTARYPGQIHAFAANLAGAMDQGKQALNNAGLQLRNGLRLGWQPRLWLSEG